jgi:S-adenosylmethionine decarboxylase
MSVGIEWVIDADGCDAERLRDLGLVRRLLETIVVELSLRVVEGGATFHAFPAPGGVTGLFLLTESHLACHTYPERGVATFNLYCCRERPEWAWEPKLRAALGASQVRVRRLIRCPDPMSTGAERAFAERERS